MSLVRTEPRESAVFERIALHSKSAMRVEHDLNMVLVCQHQMESCITKHTDSKVRALPILHRRGDNGASNSGGL